MMRRLVVILAFLAAGQGFGQSGMYNPVIHQQPRILIPYVEAPAVLVDTNGTVTANPYRNLKYCDFVLKCVDQSGADFGGAPLRYLYSSAGGVLHAALDPSPDVFFQRTSDPWPFGVLRQAFASSTQSWNDVISATNYPPAVVYRNGETSKILYFAGLYNNLPTYQDSLINTTQYDYRFIPSLGWSVDFVFHSTFENESVYAVGGVGSSLQLAADNAATAIEVYPSILPGSSSWQKAGNPKVKWMCLLSNGIDFYRDAQSGEPMWFNCVVEWVDKVPQVGQWTN
jgi:hypothetical protein